MSRHCASFEPHIVLFAAMGKNLTPPTFYAYANFGSALGPKSAPQLPLSIHTMHNGLTPRVVDLAIFLLVL